TAEVLRYFLISTHYHGPLDFSDQALQEAKQALEGFYGLFNRLGEQESKTIGDKNLHASRTRARESFKTEMDSDLTPPMAGAELQKVRSDVNKLVEMGLSTEERKRAREEFRELGAVLGLFQLDQWDYALGPMPGDHRLSGEEIDAKIAERLEARQRK